MGELTDAAGQLGSPALAMYLEERRRMASEQVKTMAGGLRESSKFMSMLRELKSN